MFRLLLILSLGLNLGFFCTKLSAQSLGAPQTAWPEIVSQSETATASVMITIKPDNDSKPLSPFESLISRMQDTDSGGSGFFLDGFNGVLVTTSYVIPDNLAEALVKDHASIRIRLSNQETRKAKLIGRDEVSGIMLLKVENPPESKLSLCDSPPLKSEEVVMIGAAYDQGPLAFRGHLVGSMDFRSETIGPYLDFLTLVFIKVWLAPLLLTIKPV
jgi:S1-C subfamily serine protease